MSGMPELDSADRAIIAATQGGLPLAQRPFQAVAREIGLTETEVITRMAAMQAAGIIRRIAAVPNHYALGLSANGMSVWDVEDDKVGELGPRVGRLDFVTHCYRRPRVEPDWPYNLFAMVHAATRPEVMAKVAAIADILGAAARRHDVLFSTKILKKSGFRLSA